MVSQEGNRGFIRVIWLRLVFSMLSTSAAGHFSPHEKWVCFAHFMRAEARQFARNYDWENGKISIGGHYLASFCIFGCCCSLSISSLTPCHAASPHSQRAATIIVTR
jgi:hypothetical protein